MKDKDRTKYGYFLKDITLLRFTADSLAARPDLAKETLTMAMEVVGESRGTQSKFYLLLKKIKKNIENNIETIEKYGNKMMLHKNKLNQRAGQIILNAVNKHKKV